MKKAIRTLAAAFLAAALAGCSGGSSASGAPAEDKTITVGATPVPHAEILNDVLKDVLAKDGWIITSSAPFVNIPNYPEIETIKADLDKLPNVIMLDIEQKAKEAGVPRSANVILLGAAQKALGIEYDKLEEAIRRVFGRKGEAIVEANIKALAIGRAAQK